MNASCSFSGAWRQMTAQPRRCNSSSVIIQMLLMDLCRYFCDLLCVYCLAEMRMCSCIVKHCCLNQNVAQAADSRNEVVWHEIIPVRFPLRKTCRQYAERLMVFRHKSYWESHKLKKKGGGWKLPLINFRRVAGLKSRFPGHLRLQCNAFVI